MITVQIDEDTAKDMLYAELDKWHVAGTERELLYDYLEEYVDGGCLDGGEFNPSEIVDNLYVNYSSFVYERDGVALLLY